MNRAGMIGRGVAPTRVIGDKIRHRREALGLTRKAVAEASGIHLSSITRWEVRGVPNTFDRHDARELGIVLGVSADWILDAQTPQDAATQEIGSDGTLRSDLLAAGKRARMRREQLGIARHRLALRLQVRDGALRQWENAGIPHSFSGEQAEAWEKALAVEPGWLLGKAAAPATPAESSSAGETQPSCTAAEIIIAVGRVLAAGSSSRTVERNAELFAMRYGINAQGRTLASVATQHGITESRACQILKLMRTGAPALPPEFLGVFHAIDATAKQHLPCTPARLEAALRPLLGEGPSIEDAWRFARDLLATHLLSLEAYLFNPPARSGAGDERVKAVHEMALAMISAVGAAHVGVLMGYAIELGWELDAVRSIREVVQTGHGFEWLDRPARAGQEWFWYGESARHNPIVQALRRVFSITDSVISLDIALGAVERLRELRLSREERCSTQYPVPPAFVTMAVLSRLKFIAGAHGRYRPAIRLDPERELTEQEHRLLMVFRRHGPIVTWKVLASELVHTGQMSDLTLRALVSRSPILCTQSPGSWMLRGARVTSAKQLEEV
ncbi:helix-turn-helix transcriptional regulator [Paraburkholderia strydomiana]